MGSVPRTLQAAVVGDAATTQFPELMTTDIAHREWRPVRGDSDGKCPVLSRRHFRNASLAQRSDVHQLATARLKRMVRHDGRKPAVGMHAAPVWVIPHLGHGAQIPIPRSRQADGVTADSTRRQSFEPI